MAYDRPPVTSEEIALDHTPLTFGKYAGQTPDDISEDDPKYIVWMYDTVNNKPTCSKTLRDACAADVAYDKKVAETKALSGRLSFNKDDRND